MAVIEKRKLQDGTISYRVKIRIKGRIPKTGSFEKLTDARDWAQKEEADLKRSLKFEDHLARKKTLADAIAEYNLYARRVMKLRERIQRERQLNWWQDRLGAYFLADISPDKLNACKRELMARPKGGEVGAPLIAAATINHYLVALSAVMAYAKDELNWINHNPLMDIKKLELNNSRVRFLSKEEREALLEACQNPLRHPLLYPLVLIALSTGMRRGELLNLHWKDVDFTKRVVRVEASKNGEKRSVPLTGRALAVLQEMAKVRKLHSNLIFARDDGLAPLVFRKHWDAALKEAKITDFRFHDLRHTAATYLLEAQATLPELSAILGHKTIQMVKRYAHLADNHAVDVMERMTERVFG